MKTIKILRSLKNYLKLHQRPLITQITLDYTDCRDWSFNLCNLTFNLLIRDSCIFRLFQKSLVGLFFIIVFTQISSAFSQETWERSESRFCNVYHRQDIDFRKLSRKLDIRAIQTTNIRRASGKEGEKEVFLEKLDIIFKKVEEVLDMYPSRINVNIRVFSSHEGLDKAYEELFNEPNTTVSFYVFKTNTIYTTEKAISESILAHEMAHCIIDHYFVILPPRKVQEILAVYADMHLFD